VPPPAGQTLDGELAAAYLRRLGLDAVPLPTGETLARLHREHLLRVPFENLDIHLGTPIVLDTGAFAEKIARRGRGGFCYELNGAFGALLAWLGFEVEQREARVHGSAGPGGRFGHLCLAVRLEGRPLLADVGFGRGGFDLPFALAAGSTHRDGAGGFELRPAGDGQLDLVRDGAPEYRFATAPSALAEFADAAASTRARPSRPSRAARSAPCAPRMGASRSPARA
jgi:N-hydroxyarylamine O-acetyltransferase